MHTTLKSAMTVGAICAFTGFTTAPSVPNEIVRSYFIPKEFFTRKELPSNNECWSKFLDTLRSIDAIVYVPLDKRAQAERNGFRFTDEGWARNVNNSITINFAKVSLVVPANTSPQDECGIWVQRTFNDLGLMVFVNKSEVPNLATHKLMLSDASVKVQMPGEMQGKYNDMTIKKTTPTTQTDLQVKGSKVADSGVKSPGTTHGIVIINSKGMSSEWLPANFDSYSK